MRARGSALVGAVLGLCCAGWLASGCAYYSKPVSGLCRVRTIPSRPFPESRVYAVDLEDIAFENGADQLWVGDDSANQLYVLDADTGAFRARLREIDFEAAFPEAKVCENESPEVDCSYLKELESVTYDPTAMTLFVLNTVNNLKQHPVVDKPAIYKLAKLDKNSNLLFVDWRPIPEGHKYGVLVAIDGKLYISVTNQLFEFDFDHDRFAQVDEKGHPVSVYTARDPIVGLASFGAYLWVLTSDMVLTKVDWRLGKDLDHWDLHRFGFRKVKGLTYGRGAFYVVEGDHPNPIKVLKFGQVQGLTRAAFLGGWPNSCP